MAAIAYVSDDKMLDYHRVNGNQEIVFWRLSTKKFSSFQKGDLLFFLSKGSDNRRKGEKGIVGYGCFTGEKKMSVNSLWKKYQGKTGYVRKEDLVNEILKTSKNDKLPETISCLFLNSVIFFQGPIYLTELGINLPKNLESYTYLDTHEGHVTLELLQKVKEIGIDYWSAALNSKTIDEEAFNNEILRYQIAAIYESMEITTIQPSLTFQKHVFNLYKEEKPVWINNDMNSFAVFGENRKLFYIYHSTMKENRKNFIPLLGQLIYIKNSLRQTLGEDMDVTIITDTVFGDTQKEVLNDNKIEFIELTTKR